ncbi:MAG: DUF2628 domain-containing protein [Bacteroidetes bacterium]|nr:DUF2628 domain-containing protein [Bacteroidota bacterium]
MPNALIPTEQELRAVLGRNGEYYIRIWEPVINGTSRSFGFNIAAFLACTLWMGYRKVYRAMFILYAAIIAEALIEDAIFLNVLKEQGPPQSTVLIGGLVVGAVCGFLANRLYLSHVLGIIGDVRAQRLDENAHLRELERRGGTSVTSAAGFLVLFVLISMLLEMALFGG